MKNQNAKQEGVVLPFILVLLVLVSSVGLGLVLQSGLSLNNTIRFSYNQIAHVASKAAIDYAEEQYELDAAYSGTPEQDLVITSKYRSTIEVEILYNEGASAKRVRAYGRVYIPQDSGDDADFTREIQSTIIRNGEVAGNPADYEPVLWLDAQEPNSLFSSTIPPNSVDITSLYGTTNKDIVEERGSDANGSNPGKTDFGGNDIELSWNGNARGHQLLGARFRNVNIPKNTTIDNAYIQFTASSTQQSGAVQLRTQGIASDNAPQWNGNYAVSSASKTTAQTTWSPSNWNDVGEAGADERVDVTAIVQEIVNRTGWNANNSMAFALSWIQGSGIRTAEKGNTGTAPQLHVQWGSGSGGGLAIADGNAVGTWVDKSGNNNNASRVYGTDGTLETAEINGMNIVRIPQATVFLSSLSTQITGNGITAFTVMKPSSAGTQNDGRFLTGMRNTQNNDNNTLDGVVLMARSGGTSTLTQQYNNTNGETLSSVVDNNWSVLSSRISALYAERLLENGTDNFSEQIGSINYNINQIYFGGRRSVNSPTQLSEMDVAEIIIYDKALVCDQMQQVENYLGLKYNITITNKNC